MSITVHIDAKQFVERMEVASREVVNALRRSVDRTARAARKESIKALAEDIGVKPSVFRSSVPTVKASTQTDISASFTIGKKRILIPLTGSNLPMRYGGGLQASTFRRTGGKSATLNIPKAFTIWVNGTPIVMIRRGKDRKDIKPIYAENPVAGFSQADGYPRKVWDETARRIMASTMPPEVQAALDGKALHSGTGGGEE